MERSWWSLAVAFLVVSSRHQALLNIEHDCIHNHFVAGRRWNERLAITLAASACGSPFYASRARHLAHHRLLATEADPDARLHTGDDKRTRGGVVRYFVLGLVGGYVATVMFEPEAVAVDPALRRRDRRNVVLGQLAVFAVFTVLFGWWTYPLLWLLPLGTLTAAMHMVRSFCEHAITDDEATAHGDRLISIRSNPVERALVAPFYMNYHAEHHQFPGVPARRLPAVQRRLKARSDGPPHLMRSTYASALARYVHSLG
ncbi:MAG: fatty acid desaturase [Acidimicrobiia bacterium]|nr:fatty acid desaturase [Acidimicrobiia bacterium]